MKIQKVKFQNNNQNYSILIGNNILSLLSREIKSICPIKKIALIFDKNIPNKLKKIANNLKKYELYNFDFIPNEKVKSLNSVNFF